MPMLGILKISFIFVLLFVYYCNFVVLAKSHKMKTKKEAMYYKKLTNGKVKCNLCFKECIISDGKRGFCRVRENKNGTLYSIVWGRPVGLQIDPIELEPMYHLLPSHKNLCVYTASCNFRCKHCHNWSITQRNFEDLPYAKYTPDEVVEKAIKEGCKSISHSINEPTVFYEYMLEIAKSAKAKKLKVLFHTNGSINPEPLKELLKYTDAVTVDLKGFNEKFYEEIPEGKLSHVLDILKIIRKENVHLEIVNLIIPTLNDNLQDIRKMCIWIKENLGENTPLHFTRFSPSYKLTHLFPTPIETLEKARDIAMSCGLKYVYIGNVAGHKGNNTYCPKCKSLLIKRVHFAVLENKIKEGKCFACNTKIEGIWE